MHDYDKTRYYALEFFKNNIDNIYEIKEYLDELYKKFINEK